MDNLPIFSATQISAFRGCRRKWGYRSIDKVKGDDNRYARKGEAVHKVAEKFLRDGTPPGDDEPGRIFKPALKYAPAPGSCLSVETLFRYAPDLQPFELSGKEDWVREIPAGIASEIEVGDWKTTSDFKWTKTQAQLLTDVQATVYAVRRMHLHAVPEVRCRWIYLLSNASRPQARCVEFVMKQGAVGPVWRSILDDCLEMAYLVETIKEAKELPADPRECERFGGCPYRSTCPITGPERMRSHMEQLSLKEKLEQRAKAVPAVNPPESENEAEKQEEQELKTKKGNGKVAVEELDEEAQLLAQLAAAKKRKAEAAAKAKAEAEAQAKAKTPKPVENPLTGNKEALAAACRQIGEGFLAIAEGLKE